MSVNMDPVADPGFPVGGRGPLMQALFGENVCENERIGSHMEWRALLTGVLCILHCICDIVEGIFIRLSKIRYKKVMWHVVI